MVQVQYILQPFFFMFIYFYIFSFLALFMNQSNPFLVLIILELQLILIIYFMCTFSFIIYSVIGLVISLFIIAFAGAEASTGISFLIAFYRLRGLFSANPFSGLSLGF